MRDGGSSTDVEPWRLGALDLAAGIKDGRWSCMEVIGSFLERIDLVQPVVNALTDVLADPALEAARRADEQLARGEEAGLLHGVPFTVKETIDCAGSRTAQGTEAYAAAAAIKDAPQVARLREAGAIPIARTNMPEFGYRWHTANAINGATSNPWNDAVTPGGSSGGEAVALATGMSPLGVGDDLGGSLRWPSQCCGTAALKPTLGRVPGVGAYEDQMLAEQLMLVTGPMARSVADLRAAFGLMCLPDPIDPWYTPVPVPAEDGAVRVAVVLDPGGLGVDPSIRAGVAAAADRLSNAGFAVSEVDPPSIADAAATWAILVATDIDGSWGEYDSFVGAEIRRFVRLLLEWRPSVGLDVYATALMERQRHLREWNRFLQEWPLVLTPVSCRPPFTVGDDLTAQGLVEHMTAIRAVVACNVLGLPAAVVPVGVQDGLPLAVQVIGRRFAETTCLKAAAVLESAFGRITPIDPVRLGVGFASSEPASA